MSSVSVRGLRKVFGSEVVALDAIDLEIGDGEFFALLGPSGCGKTTLLRSIAGLETPTAGTVHIGARDVTTLAPGKRDVGMVFQDYALYPHMDVTANVGYSLKVRKVARAERDRRAADVAGALSLGELLARRPGELSGGQQQRVALARAIAHHPSVFLFDEPLSNLDARLRLEARTYLRRLQQDLAVSAVYVTHDQAEALAMADRMAVMRHGRIEQLGSPAEVFDRPATTFVAGFVGAVPMNLLPARHGADGLTVLGATWALHHDAEDVVAVGADLVVGVRPEHLHLCGAGDPGALCTGDVAVTELLGTTHLVTLQTAGPEVRVVTTDPPPRGARAGVRVSDPSSLLLYDDGGRLVDVPSAIATPAFG